MTNGQFDVRFRNSRAYDDTIAQIAGVVSDLERLGLRVPENSRLRSYLDSLEAFRDAAQHRSGASRFDQAMVLQAMHDGGQLRYILDIFRVHPEFLGWEERLQRAIFGATLPRHEGENTNARDLQYELYLAAICLASNHPAELAEPDVLVTSEDSFRFRLAAKRIKSLRALQGRARKARRQILSSGYPGVICIDVSKLITPNGAMVRVQLTDHALPVVERMIKDFLVREEEHIRQWARDDQVFGLIANGVILCEIVDPPRLMTAQRFTVACWCDEADPRYAALRDFAGMMPRALGTA